MATPSIDTDGVRALTFDCYGTLIDWDGGIRSALEALPSLAGADLERLIEEREREELRVLEGDYLPYREVLEQSLGRAAELQRRVPTSAEARAFFESMGSWPPFDDSRATLERLARRFGLAILSNVETSTLRASVELLGAPFDLLVTAQEIRSYKPARKHFDEGLRGLRLRRDEVLHVAGSLVHDIRPARALGWRTIWINRRAEPVPDDLDAGSVFPDLASLADALLA